MSTFISTPQPFRTMVIKPGETQVIKKGIKILKTINEGNVTVTSNCADITDQLGETSEDLVQYALIIEVMDELVNRGNGPDMLTGVGLGADFYPFASPISLNEFKGSIFTPSSGGQLLFTALTETLPNGIVFLRSPTFVMDNWGGPAGDSARDDVFRTAVKFKSFPSVVEDMGMYIVYENHPTLASDLSVYNMRIYPSRVPA